MKQVTVLSLIMLFIPIAHSKQCGIDITQSYENDGNSIYSEVPILSSFNDRSTTDSLIKHIENNSKSLWRFKVSCKTESVIKFEAYLLESRAIEFDGFYLVSKQYYKSGPHSLLDKSVVIIQGDM